MQSFAEQPPNQFPAPTIETNCRSTRTLIGITLQGLHYGREEGSLLELGDDSRKLESPSSDNAVLTENNTSSRVTYTITDGGSGVQFSEHDGNGELIAQYDIADSAEGFAHLLRLNQMLSEL
jgi:hypothetical protein